MFENVVSIVRQKKGHFLLTATKKYEQKKSNTIKSKPLASDYETPLKENQRQKIIT